MPNIYAHQSFANKIYDMVNDNVKELINKNKELYLLGSLASDPLFYYKPLKGLPLSKKASKIHNQNIYNLLQNSKSYDSNMKSFLLGYITHFVLDYNIHKYIYNIEKQGYSHAKIESELEKRIILLNNKKFNQIDFNKHIYLNNKIDTNLLFDISNEVYLKSLKDTRFVVKWIYTRNPFRTFIVKLLLKITGNYKQYSGLIISKKDHLKYKEIVDECERIYLNSINHAFDLVNNYYDYLFNKVELSKEFYNTFEGGLYEGKAK